MIDKNKFSAYFNLFYPKIARRENEIYADLSKIIQFDRIDFFSVFHDSITNSEDYNSSFRICHSDNPVGEFRRGNSKGLPLKMSVVGRLHDIIKGKIWFDG